MAQVQQHLPRLQELVGLSQMLDATPVPQCLIRRVLGAWVMADQISVAYRNSECNTLIEIRFYGGMVDNKLFGPLQCGSGVWIGLVLGAELGESRENEHQAVDSVFLKHFNF